MASSRSTRAVLLVLLATAAACARGERGTGLVDGGADVRTDASWTRWHDASAEDASTDATAMSDADPEASVPDANVPDANASDSGLCVPSPGSVVITELMIASVAGSNDRGEWFEVTNLGACSVDLSSLTVVSPTATGVEKTHTVVAGEIAPGDSYVFALSDDTADNHGISFDYCYDNGSNDDIVLNNSTDWLELRVGAAPIDRVTWPGSSFVVGASRYFPSSLAPSQNDDWSKWCTSTTVYSSTGGTFRGSPGAANPGTCP